MYGLSVEADEDGSDPLGITGLIFPSLRFTLTAPSRLWSIKVLFFQSCITVAAFNHGRPSNIEYEELWGGRFITTKATRKRTPTILTRTFFTSPKGDTLLWSANLMEKGASSILGKFHSSYNLREIMFIPDPPSTIDGIGLQFLWVTGKVTLDVSPSQLARAMFCLSAPSSMKSHSTSSWGGFLSLANQATRSTYWQGSEPHPCLGTIIRSAATPTPRYPWNPTNGLLMVV